MGMTAVIKTHKQPGDYQNRCCLWAFDGVTWPIYKFTEQMSKEYQKNDFNNSMMSNCQKVAFFLLVSLWYSNMAMDNHPVV
jgi:hypothetical protein